MTLTGASTAQPTFTAPTVSEQASLVFTLTVSDGTVSATDTVTITVNAATNQAPTANAGPDQKVASGASVTLDGSESSDPDDGDTISYSWSQTSGTPTVTLTNASADNPTFTAPTVSAAVDLVFTLTVTDSSSQSDTDTVTITIGNTAPVASAGLDQIVSGGTTVTLDGSGSTDADGDDLTYQWTRRSGPQTTLTGANTQSASYVSYGAAQTYTMVFRLTVSDGVASSHDDVTITIQPATSSPPSVNAGPDTQVKAKESLSLMCTATDPDGDTLDLCLVAGDRQPAGRRDHDHRTLFGRCVHHRTGPDHADRHRAHLRGRRRHVQGA